MGEAELYELFGQRVLLVALSVTRIATAFVLLPLFAQEDVPPLVRGAVFVTLALVAATVQPSAPLEGLSSVQWVALFAKEVFIGAVIGVFFGLFLWAFEAAGVVIDMQIGASFALFFDPIIGNEVTLIGQLLARWAAWLFLASGGLLLFVGALLESFAAWPVTEPVGSLRAGAVRLFEAELSGFMSLVVRIAGPIMLVLFLIDVAMGLLNRYAPQFNVFFLSMSVKSMAAILLVMVMLPYLVDVLREEIAVQGGGVDAVLERVLER